MKSRWLVLMMAAFLVFLGSPMGVWACQKAMNTAQSESSDEMGLSSSGSPYDNEEMAPAYPENEGQQGVEGLTPSSPGLDEGRDEMTPSSPGTDDWRDEMTPSSPGTENGHGDELTPSGSQSDEYSNQGSSMDQGSEIYYP